MKNNQNLKEQKLFVDALQNKQEFFKICSETADLLFAPATIGGLACYAVWCDGMINVLQSWEMLFKQLQQVTPNDFRSTEQLVEMFTKNDSIAFGAKACENFGDAVYMAMSGFIILFIDRCETAVAFPAQGFSFRTVSDSATEENVRSSRESFAEPIRVNMSLIRRRLKTEKLVFKLMKVGELSQTEVAIAYLNDRVPKEMLAGIEKRLGEIDMEMVLESGFIEPFFENRRFRIFSGVGHTERPDTLCGKLKEGRVAILVDGTPFAILMPYLFSDNFQTFDDYTNKPYYVAVMRILKYAAFFISILLPGLYVALVNFNPEIMPSQLLYRIAQSQNSTPYPLMVEALFIHVVYEIVREAGLRLPKPVGHAVGLIGALVVGDAAVKAGLIGSPMVMVVALTAISSFMIPLLYEPITVLRLLFILIGGTLGPVGITLGLCVVLINISSINAYGIPYMTGLTPYGKTAFKSQIFRQSWKRNSRKKERLSSLPGSHIEEGKQDG